MNNKIVRMSAVLALVSLSSWAQEQDSIKVNRLNEVVISDTKFAQSKEKSGKVITTISQEELQKKSGQSLANVLSSAVGIEINGSQSANGKNLGYYIRGGKNQQVLVLIDGIPVTDASGISFEYDLRLLPVDQVESIEIMKGAASTLYGTGAATAVINITLKKSGRKPIQANGYMNIGSNNTATNSKYNGQDFNQGFSVNGTASKVNYTASVNSSETNGMSQIASPEDVTYENDRFSRLNLMSKIGFKATKKLTLDFFGNYDVIKNDYDFTYDNTGFNDTNLNKTQSKQFRFGFSPKYTYAKGEFILNSSFNKIQRSYSEANSFTSAIESSLYEAQSLNLDGFNKYKWSKNFFTVVGVNYQFHDMLGQTPYSDIQKESTKFNMIDPYFTGVFTSNFGLNINAGARLNMHSEYGNQVVYNVNPSFSFGEKMPLKLLASLSTAYVTPSLYQLYSEYGNTTLTPEENTTVEAGFEINLLKNKLNLNAVGFFREQKNSFGFFFDSTTFEAYYINIEGTNRAKGVETEVSYTVNSNVKVGANYTFTQVDEALNRLIPKHKANASLDISVTRRLFFNVNYQYVDGRNDAFFDGNTFATMTTKLGSYQLVNALVKFELIKNRLSVFGNATNILNEEFIENVGYSTRGRNYRLGLTINL
ncbi:MAG: TonB-dependent receptor plug domain-containing protein [Bacteroidota bacterium]